MKFTKTLVTLSTLAVAATPTFAQTNSPALQLITPSENQTIYGENIPILFNVENFELVDPQTNSAPTVGKGHINLWLDDQKPTKESATPTFKDTFTFRDVGFGDHTLKAELVGNNNSSLNPPVVVNIKFKTAALTSPAPTAASGFDKNTALVILVVVALVIVAAWWYTKEEDEVESQSIKSKSKVNNKKTAKRRR